MRFDPVQVQKVLRNLTLEGGLQEDHLDLLWNLTEKACMSEHMILVGKADLVLSEA